MSTNSEPAETGRCLSPTGRCSQVASTPGNMPPTPQAKQPAPTSSDCLRSSEVWRRMWSKNLVLLANMPPQVGQAATFSWVWLRRCSRSLQWSLKVQVQPGKEGPVMLQHKPAA